ncbi:MAG: hypothetical protein SCK29_10465, partial [Bacillota bacterium]|nr:hypothetical protein [Bacillota bacterium]
MNCIELMVEEHKNIKRMLSVIRKTCYKILTGEEMDYNLNSRDFIPMPVAPLRAAGRARAAFS